MHIICICNYPLTQVSLHCLAASLPSFQGVTHRPEEAQIHPPALIFPFTHAKKKNQTTKHKNPQTNNNNNKPPHLFFTKLNTSIPHPSPWPSSIGSSQVRHTKASMGHGDSKPCRAVTTVGAQDPPAPQLRRVRCSCTSTSGGTTAMLGCPWAQGYLIGGNNREKKKPQILNTGIGRWKVMHYPSLLPGLLNTPHPLGVGGRKSCLARGQLESPPNHPQVLHGQLEASGEQGRGVKDYAKGQARGTAGSSSAHLYHRH